MIDSNPTTWTQRAQPTYGKAKPGKQDGTGPAKGSAERKAGRPGKGRGPCKPK